MDNDTLVFQSFHRGPYPHWLTLCLQSVEHLADQRGWDYEFIGDELFDLLPLWFAEKVSGRGPILSDLGRLLAARERLKRYRRVIWLDADVLIFAPERFTLPEGSFGFGRERWVQPRAKGRGWKIHRSVCNALCYFERDNPFLDFYIYTCQSTIKRANPEYIAPQMIGPKLLTALHNLSGFPLTECVGSASPDLLIDIMMGEGKALDYYLQRSNSTSSDSDISLNIEAGLNLCHSLVDAETYRGMCLSETALDQAAERLLSEKSLMKISMTRPHS